MTLADGRVEWTFRWEPDVHGVAVQELKIADGCAVSFEDEAARIENEICSVPGLLCNCCAGGESKICESCMYATSFHRCNKLPARRLWRKGSLYGVGTVDYQRVEYGSVAVCSHPCTARATVPRGWVSAGTSPKVLLNLHRKGLPIDALKTKADEYILAGLLTVGDAENMVKNIEAERGKERLLNDPADGEDADAADDRGKISEKLTREEMEKELHERVEKMRAGAAGDGVPDQYRVAREFWDRHPPTDTGRPARHQSASLHPHRSTSTLWASWRQIDICGSWYKRRLEPAR